ncbi:myeloid leukemia factor 1 isoform X1 [Narcine bancroftii]|uniref:myeloid leukemia factor 1 isoform X1 n=1 Tax=Narcine bancroftii TaxID=1343680 RepID=UPI003831FFDF
MFGELEEDPFFSDPFRAHQENLHRLMSNFPVQLDQDLLVNFTGGKIPTQTYPRQQHSKETGKLSEMAGSSMDPFNKMMEQMRKEMFEMQQDIKNASHNSNNHTLNTSTVMSYAKVGNEPPKVFQASNYVHRVPNGIKETRRALKDSESGIEKLSIGHHIKDRAHVIQKIRNQKTGDEEVDQEFVNLNEDDAQMFDHEWQEKVSKVLPPGAQVYGLQDVKRAMNGQRTKHGKKQPVPHITSPSTPCDCPNTSYAATGLKGLTRNSRK